MLKFFVIITILIISISSHCIASIQAKITIDENKVINPQIIGSGVNFAFSDYEYFDMLTGAQWDNIKSQHLPFPNDKEEWNRFFKLMDFSNFQYVRFCVGLSQWEPVNDNDDPYEANFESGFAFSPKVKETHPEIPLKTYEYMAAMYKLLDHWEKQNKYVILGNWDAGKNNFCPDGKMWLREKDENGNDIFDHTKLCAVSIPEYTESLAAIMYHLKKEKKYNCVKGISFYNEPEQFSNYYNVLAQVYNLLGYQLEQLGIRDMVKIQAFDGAIFWNREDEAVKNGVEKLLNMTGKNIDIVSVHDYWTYFDYMKEKPTGVHGTIEEFMINQEVKPALEQINAYNKENDGKRFFVMGEMGSFAYTDGDSGEANYMQRLHNAEFTARAFNSGVKAVAYWVYNNNHHSHWRFLTFDKETDQHFIPEDVNYYPMSLVMKYIQNGSDIVMSTVDGATDTDGNQRIWCSVAKKEKDTTILIINDSNEDAVITINGIKKGTSMRKLFVSKEKTDKINIDGELKINNNLKISLEPLSITVLTTYSYGNEKPL